MMLSCNTEQRHADSDFMRIPFLTFLALLPMEWLGSNKIQIYVVTEGLLQLLASPFCNEFEPAVVSEKAIDFSEMSQSPPLARWWSSNLSRRRITCSNRLICRLTRISCLFSLLSISSCLNLVLTANQHKAQ